MIFQIGILITAVTAFDQACILIVNSEARCVIGIDADPPASRVFAYKHVRHHILGMILTDTVTGMRVSALDQFDDFGKLGIAGLQASFKQGHIITGQLLEVLFDQHPCFGKMRCFRVVLPQLDSHAIARRGGRNAYRVETLYQVQYRLDFINFQRVVLLQQAFMNFLDTFSQVAIVVDRVDDGEADVVIGL